MSIRNALRSLRNRRSEVAVGRATCPPAATDIITLPPIQAHYVGLHPDIAARNRNRMSESKCGTPRRAVGL